GGGVGAGGGDGRGGGAAAGGGGDPALLLPEPAAAPPLLANDGGGGGGGNQAGGGGGGAAANDEDDADILDMEVHVALDELLGVRGPLPTLLRNVLWLLAFNGAYLGLFAFVPFSVGSSAIAAIEKRLGPDVGERWGAPPLLAAARALRRASADGDHTLQLPDLATVCLGYMLMSTMVFAWRAVVYGVCDRADLPALRRVRRAVRVTAAVVKVGVLLSLKMLLLPLLLGVCLDAVTLPLFGATPADRVAFMSHNLVGALLVHWVLGITFMLFVTVSVLQLREVMHPDLLAHVIRPQEPHPDLLGSLLQESGKIHARRMAMSLGIYVVLLLLFVWAPVRLALALFPWALPLEARLCYLVPQLQIPVELITFHLGMLAFLERFKNHIGEIQHLWLRFVCARFGLTRYLLPLPVLQRIAPLAALPGAPSRQAGRGLDGSDEADGIVVGRPLRRPPAGWDDPAGVAQGRWAWGSEALGPEEHNLAPRRLPPGDAIPRLAALLLLAWASILVVSLAVLLLPSVLGRRAFALLHMPPRWSHDPFAFAVGAALCRTLYSVCASARAILRWEWEEVRFRPLIAQGAGVVAARLVLCALVPGLVSPPKGSWSATFFSAHLSAQLLLVFRSALLAHAIIFLGQCVSEPVVAWLRMLHDSVRDDRYLLGLQLQNH
ncbi:unnamed protein product, partial [Phaeothamnion confervicola]